MRFFNPDGREADMCGNGARCVARLAAETGAAPGRMRIQTQAGLLQAEVDGASVRLGMTEPKDWRMNRVLRVGRRRVAYDFVNSGVPHAVVTVDDLDGTAVAELGAAIRHHRAFAPAGTNADFVTVTGPRSLRIRTYERGVEAETLACGTGIVAAALTAGRSGRIAPPVSVTCASGDVLEVGYVRARDGAGSVTLLGPTAHVFEGTIRYP